MSVTINREELQIKAIRSSGPGGQNVNKVCSKIQLRFPLYHVSFLEEEVAQRLENLFPTHVTKEKEFWLECSETRDQKVNLELACEKLERMIERAQFVPKPRKKTKPSKAVKKQIREKKEQHSQKKQIRREKFGYSDGE